MNIDDIIKEYGQEKGMEVINEHFVKEINILRWTVQSSPVDTSHKIIASSQKQAEYLDKTGKIQHMSGSEILPKRLNKDNIVFVICWENLAEWQKTIKQLIEDWLKSKTHKANLINLKFKLIGLWYKNWKRVYIAIG